MARAELEAAGPEPARGWSLRVDRHGRSRMQTKTESKGYTVSPGMAFTTPGPAWV